MATFSTRAFLVLALCSAAGIAAAAEPAQVEAPKFKVGDTWVFDQTIEKGPSGFNEMKVDLAIERLDGDTMMVGIKRDGAPNGFEDHMMGSDWSQRRIVDGEETVTTRPLTFPLSIGQSWSIDYTDATHRGAQLSDHVHRTYKVIGWEDVETPAGTFHALKVEAKGVDKAVMQTPSSVISGASVANGGATTMAHTQRGGVGTITREIIGQFYYVPELRNYAKSIEEQYNTDNVRLYRETRTLVSFKPASQAGGTASAGF